MSHPRVHAASAAQAFWLALIDVAMLTDWQEHILAIATDSMFSNKSIEYRLKAIRWHLEQGILPEAVAEMGAERTVSDFQKAMNLNTGKQPGETTLWSKRVPHDLKLALEEMLTVIRSATGASDEDILRFLADTFRDSSPQEILFLYQQHLGVQK